jgi:mannosyltransferase OCH1-like enzyme
MIPKNIFQTHKSLEYIKSKPKVKNAVLSWITQANNPDFKYYFFNNEQCDLFMKEIGGKVYQAYQRLPMNVMKADLWRYSIIYKYGGIYADADTICKVNPNIFIHSSYLTMCPENETHFCQWCFSAPASSPILKSIIDLSVERILTIPEIKGEHIIHFLTGPGVFTDGIIKYLKENDYPVFNELIKYHNYPHSDVLRVFHPYNFQSKFIIHVFTGGDKDGWLNERNKKLI